MNVASLLGRLLRLVKPGKRQLPGVHVVLFTRAGCHLCEVALEELTRAQHDHGFALEKTDVDTDPELAARCGDSVPVFTVDGKVRFRGQVNPILMRRLLDNVQASS
jgi:glutaredoxin